jgi:prophage regulatory protein
MLRNAICYPWSMKRGDAKMAKTNQQALPEAGFIRLPQVLGVFPVSKSTWWDGIARGKYPQGVKLSDRITAWRVQDIRKLIEDRTQ